jgi:tripartite-type tricarboxylate transporter receptor subunit TctC
MPRMEKGLRHAAIGVLALFGVSGAWAQSYPVKPVRLLVGFASGGGTDVTARFFAQKMSPQLGQSVVIENRPGAAGSIAAGELAKSAPDGYRLLMIASGTFIHDVLSANMSYSLERDFAPISLVTISPLVLVIHPSLRARSVNDLVVFARSRPGQLSYGSDGVGATSHLGGELFNMLAKVKLVHVPYKGNADAAMALASGQIEVGFPSMASAMPLFSAGKFRALAVTSIKRSSLAPSLPTLDESGLRGYNVTAWFGVLAPAGTPKSIIDRLNAVIANVANASDTKEAVGKQGLEIEIGSPEQFAAFMRESVTQISRLGKDANIKLE